MNKTHRNITRFFIFSCLSLLLWQLPLAQEVVRYDLYVRDTIVHYAGKDKRAIAVNGKIPMPTLYFTQGDTAEIVVHNQLDEPTALHWHGVWVPNKEDGVPFLTQKPIMPGETHTYRFPILQHGTHWYHSHSGFQEQIGMYGSYIMLKREGDSTIRPGIDNLPTMPLILSEWSNLKPKTIQRMLHNSSDWFSIKKGATQSYWEAILQGHFATKLTNEWKRMHAMDVSDIYYDKVLINGRELHTIRNINGRALKAGDKIRLRIANAGSSSYFWLNYAGGDITVVANDGNDVVPVSVDRLLISVSETYDIVISIPENGKSYQLLATTEDRSKTASIFFGDGVKQYAPTLPPLKYFEGMKMMNAMMKLNGGMKDMGMPMSMQSMDMNSVMYPELNSNATHHSDDGHSSGHHDKKTDIIENHPHHKMHQGMNMDDSEMHHGHQDKMYMTDESVSHKNHKEMQGHHTMHKNTDNEIKTLNYTMLRSPHKTVLDEDAPVKEIEIELTGNMNRYVWSMNEKILSESDKIPVEQGVILRIVLHNNTMMRHPIHLHGFDFRILNGQGEHAPMKTLLDIMPMETDTIEFLADKEGSWFFHCHILYHMMSGMNRVFDVGDYDNPLLPNAEKAYKKLQRHNNMLYFSAESDFASNGVDGGASLSNARWDLSTEWRVGYNDLDGYEVETQLGRYIGRKQWFKPFIAFDWHYRKIEDGENTENLFGQRNEKDARHAFSIGFVYTLPMLIDLQAQVYQDGIVRISLSRDDIPLSPRLRAGFMVNTDLEYMVGLRYILHKNIGIRAHYDSDMGPGIGLQLNL